MGRKRKKKKRGKKRKKKERKKKKRKKFFILKIFPTIFTVSYSKILDKRAKNSFTK